MGGLNKDNISETSEMYNSFDRDLDAGVQRDFRSWFPFSLLGKSSYTPVQDTRQTNNVTTLALELGKKDTTLRRWQCVSGVLTVLLVVLSVFLTKPPSRFPQPKEGTDNVLKWMKQAEVVQGHFWCGPTTAEAKERGCTFNKLHNRWMSPHCTADFEPAREAVFKALDGDVPEFVFYRDENGEPGNKISEEELDELEILTPAWTTVGHHTTHCMYLLLQAAASLNLGTKADMVVHAWEHAGHCASVIMNITKTAPGWDDVASFGHIQSGVCW